ncbi:MAG: sulfatase [Candidatus Pacebacteria bacterium]|nr:sulfatase [Candidatus Paceibacterota bacterium]
MQKPNIVFILLDDFGWTDLSCYGSTFYETPNLDRLATRSMRFTDAYAACPVCSPTRASIMSGKYPARLGLTNYISWVNPGHQDKCRLIEAPYVPYLSTDENSLASTLKEIGYTTWHIGKWHMGEEPYWPDKHGFDVNIGGCDLGHPNNGYFSPYNIPNLEDGPEGEYLTDRLTDEAIKLIRHNEDSPFFLNLWYYTVHTPIQGKPELVAKYERKARALGLDKVKTFEEGEIHPKSETVLKRIRRRLVQSDPVYAAMIECMDANVGRLLKAIEEKGELDNNIVIFTSDNGGLATSEGSPTCNAPLSEGKGWMYEGGTREPLIVCWPGVTQPNSICREPVTSPDFYPTILDMIGADPAPDQHVDGVSFTSLLKGQKPLDRDGIFWHYPHYGNQGGTPGSSIRTGDWKLIEFYEDSRLELYNLREDVGETVNLAGTRPDITQRLHQRLKGWRVDMEALEPTPNPDWAW